ncbi:MAG TPA: transglutaminaseTgpA domain-containing protein [Acidimicrobiales bacterium]|nr:transglutaminaseTgpA domain-containing protein [Acidimicrobiales bacterium]
MGIPGGAVSNGHPPRGEGVLVSLDRAPVQAPGDRSMGPPSSRTATTSPRPEEAPGTFVSRGTRLLVVCLLVATAASTFAASTPWLRAYQVARAPLILAFAAVLPVAFAACLSWVLRVAPLLSYAASAAGLAVYLWLVNGFDFSSAWDGLVHVPAQLLSETLPLSGTPYLLSAPVVLSWLCGAIAAELFVRPARPAAAGLMVPLLYFVFAFVATTSAPVGAGVAASVSLLGALMLCALARQAVLERERALVQARSDDQHSRRTATLRRAALFTAMAAVLAADFAAAVPGALSFGGKPATVSRPTQLLSGVVVDPLDALASLRDSNPSAPPVVLFKAHVLQTWNGYMTLAALDDYDGDVWTFSATFRPTGGRVPEPTSAVTYGGERLVQHYFIERPVGLPFLPAADRPVQVDGLPVDVDQTTGMLAASPPLPATYTVVSQVPAGTLAELNPDSPLASGANVPGGDTPAYTSLPAGSAEDVVAAVRFAERLTGVAASTSLGFFQKVAVALRTDERRVSPDVAAKNGQTNPAALAGTSLAQVMNAVTVDRAATPEQFATFLAVVARYLGVPSRVVTGFRAPAAASANGPLPAGDYTLTNRDAWTWDELPVAGVGWVVVDPTPIATTVAPSPPPEQVRATPTTQPRQATALPGNGAAHAIAKPVKVKPSQPVRVDWPLVLGIGVPLVLVIGVLSLVLVFPALRRRARRSARHKLGDPTLLAAGAWLELLDGLSRLGLEVPPSATSTEIADSVAEHFGDDFGPPARRIGALADQAIYSSAWPVAIDDAKAAWASQARLNEEMLHSVARGTRARALLRVGSLPARPSQRGG